MSTYMTYQPRDATKSFTLEGDPSSSRRKAKRRNRLRGLLTLASFGVPTNFAGTIKVGGRKMPVFAKPGESPKQAKLRMFQELGIPPTND